MLSQAGLEEVLTGYGHEDIMLRSGLSYQPYKEANRE